MITEYYLSEGKKQRLGAESANSNKQFIIRSIYLERRRQMFQNGIKCLSKLTQKKSSVFLSWTPKYRPNRTISDQLENNLK